MAKIDPKSVPAVKNETKAQYRARAREVADRIVRERGTVLQEARAAAEAGKAEEAA